MLGRLHTLAAIFGAALALASTGCSFITGEYEAETEFLVKPNSATEFSGWSEIDISEDPQSVDSAELMYVNLEAKDTSIRDLAFILSITGDAKVDETFTRVAEKSPMPPGERIVPLDQVYDGDLRQFFYKNPEKDAYTIHITWHGTVDPTYPLPAEGVWIRVRVAVRVE